MSDSDEIRLTVDRGDAATPRILIIEEEKFIIELMYSICRALGFQDTVHAPFGDEGFKMFEDVDPDVVITGYWHGVKDGLQMTRRLRDPLRSLNPMIPVIMLSSHTEMEDVKAARDCGVTEFVAKPLTIKAVIQRMSSIIEHPRMFVMSASYFGPDRRRTGQDYDGVERRSDESHIDTDTLPQIDMSAEFAAKFVKRLDEELFR